MCDFEFIESQVVFQKSELRLVFFVSIVVFLLLCSVSFQFNPIVAATAIEYLHFTAFFVFF